MDHHDGGDTKSPHDLHHSDVNRNNVNGNNGGGAGAGGNTNGLMGSNGNSDIVDDNDEDVID